jgi:3-deoxy-D-manno-octulosonate 8-phosphate phosphatase (KDO 8-P phosphatase)
LAVKIAEKLLIPVYFISAKKSLILNQRAKELGVSGCYDGVSNKVEVANKICKELNIGLSEVCYIGDDLVDLALLRKAGFSATVKNCAKELLTVCDFVSSKKGGKGAFREIVEFIVKSQNKWEEVMAFFEK